MLSGVALAAAALSTVAAVVDVARYREWARDLALALALGAAVSGLAVILAVEERVWAGDPAARGHLWAAAAAVVLAVAGGVGLIRRWEVSDPTVEHGTSLWSDAWKRLRKNRMAVVSAVIVGGVILFCTAGPWIVWYAWGYDYRTQDVALGAAPPSWRHLFGTDILGRDLMVRLMDGGRVSLAVGVISTAVSLVIGVTYGALSGYAGGRVDNAMMRFVDILFSLPYMLLVIVLMAISHSRSIFLLFAALGAVSWLTMARIVRGQVLSLKHREFVEAARASGSRPGSIVFKHLIPNTLGPVVVYSTLTIPAVMLEESFLSFIGLGIQEPLASWGTLVNEGANSMVVFPWMLIFPGVLMALTLFSLNFLGDGLRDALDPQLRKD
jgi:oligopeptide transport system permease protein